MNNLLIISLVLILPSSKLVSTGSCLGCVELDVLTFDKLLPKFKFSLIKFDIAFPYGEKHEAFATFTKEYTVKLNDDMLFGLVGIKDYGDKENSELGERFEVDDKKFPMIILFRNDSATSEHVKWPEHLDVDYKNLKKFVRDNTDLYVGLDGCIREFDDFAKSFMVANDETTAALVLEKAKVDAEEKKGLSQFYTIIMEKILQKGKEFLLDESNRLKSLLQKKVSDSKRQEILHKLNILKAFEVHLSSTKKDEL